MVERRKRSVKYILHYLGDLMNNIEAKMLYKTSSTSLQNLGIPCLFLSSHCAEMSEMI